MKKQASFFYFGCLFNVFLEDDHVEKLDQNREKKNVGIYDL